MRSPFKIISLILVFFALSGCDNRTHISNEESLYSNGKTHVSEVNTVDFSQQLQLEKTDFVPAKRLEIITWSDFIPQEVYDFFEETYGTKVIPTLIESNEEMLQLLQKNPEKYDLVMPDNYMVKRMITAGLLSRLDHGNIKNIELLDEDVRRVEYDRGLLYTVPLSRDSVGIAFNIKYVPGIPRDWQYIIKMNENPYLKFRVSIRKEMRIALGIALMLNGHSPNSTNIEELQAAKDLLIFNIQQYGVMLIGPESVRKMREEDILLGVVWNGNAAHVLNENSDIRFLLPEGNVLVVYGSIAISTGSTEKRTAELFIDYLLEPVVSANISNFNFFANCNPASLPFLKTIVRNGPSYFFPSEENRLFLQDLGKDIYIYEQAWQEVLQAKPLDTLVKLPLPKAGFFHGEATEPTFTQPEISIEYHDNLRPNGITSEQ